jgi:hypothetical protein
VKGINGGMTLYRSHDTLKVWLAWLSLVALVAYLVVVMAHLILVANVPAPAITSKGILLIALMLISSSLPAVLINLLFVAFYSRHVSLLRTIAQRDPRYLRSVATQPPSDLALADGETLTLTRTQTRGETYFQIFRLVPFIIVPLSALPLLLMLLPSPYTSPLSPPLPSLYDSASHRWLSLKGPLDWVSAALPFVLIAAMIPLLAILLSSRRIVLHADDRGLTYEKDRQRHFIAWDDIQLVMRRANDSDDQRHRDFLIWGTSARIEFSIAGPDDARPHASTGIIPYTFSGGYEAYERDARRLLATIVARSQQPLTYWRKDAGPRVSVRA